MLRDDASELRAGIDPPEAGQQVIHFRFRGRAHRGARLALGIRGKKPAPHQHVFPHGEANARLLLHIHQLPGRFDSPRLGRMVCEAEFAEETAEMIAKAGRVYDREGKIIDPRPMPPAGS